jgi:hypothetical protein
MLPALLDATQVLGTVQIDGATHEVCDEAIANHDRRSNQLTVNLRAFLRSEQQDHIGEQCTSAWLPHPQTTTEHVEAEEAHAVASYVFRELEAEGGRCGASLSRRLQEGSFRRINAPDDPSRDSLSVRSHDVRLLLRRAGFQAAGLAYAVEVEEQRNRECERPAGAE